MTALTEGVHYTQDGAGHFTFPAGVLEGYTVTITYQVQGAANWQSALGQLGLSLAPGLVGQGVWSWLQSYDASQALAYSGLSYVYAEAYPLTNQAEVENHSFEVVTGLQVGGGIVDAWPHQILQDFLGNAYYGVGWPTNRLSALTAFSQYVMARQLWISPVMEQQRPAREWMQEFADLTNSEWVWQGTVLDLVPRGDEAISSSYGTYTPNTTPAFDLVHAEGGDLLGPVEIEPVVNEDAHNIVRIQWTNRANGYNVEIMDARDDAHIELFGERPADVVNMEAIHDPAVAQSVAQQLLQREMTVWNRYKFRTPFSRALMSLMTLVTLTDGDSALDRVPVRITGRREAGDLQYEFDAEDAPIGAASAPTYGQQGGLGFAHDYNTPAPSVVTPLFFESPVERTSTGLEVCAAVSGSGPAWGGCRVWTSLDGVNYKEVATLHGGSRYGVLTGSITDAATSMSVILAGNGGQMVAGTANDAAALSTLCWVSSPSGGEYVAHAGATLTGPGAYTLSGLVRGIFATPKQAHAANSAFARVDDAIARSGSLDLSLIGATLWFKFTSFNVYGGGEQDISTVTAYQYTITGAMAMLPPKAPTGILAAGEPFGVRLSCTASPDPDVVRYEWRVGPSWASAPVVASSGGTSFLWRTQVVGTYTAWVAAVDVFGNYSVPASASVTIVAATLASLTPSILGPDLLLDWAAAAGAYAIDSYEVRYGSSWAGGTSIGVFKVTKVARRVDWGGARQWWVAPIDVNGNVGAPLTVIVTVAAPGAVTSQRSEVIDNNVLLYWQPPASGTLPVDRYEVRKGATWAGGAVVGSNGNSTFAAVFEQASGVYTYWVAAYDSAGNVGTPIGITATVNQPPDYILRTNIDSALTGTLVNMIHDGATLLGPVDTAATWSTHFTGNSWATPQDQVTAGKPLYLEPSVTSASYSEVVDYGAVLPPTNITATLNTTLVDGSVSVSCQIAYKTLAGDPWTNAPAGSAVLATNFRYVQVTWTFTAAAGANLLRVNGFNLKLSSKLKTDSGSGTAVSTDVGGTVCSFTIPFLSADAPVIQPVGTAAVIGMVDYTATPNPTTFKVLLFDRSTGARVSGAFSWTARGY